MIPHSQHCRQVCTFAIGEETYGVDILDIKEIHTENRFTPIHHAPACLRGYVNIRGQIHLIVDLRVLLGHSPCHNLETSRILLFKPEAGEAFGVLVDRIGDVCPAPENRIEPMDSPSGRNFNLSGDSALRRLSTGILKNERELVTLLSGRSIYQHLAGLFSEARTE
ncbi:chemotaxis protein CheW [Desulfobotulus sp.]|jgi:purine-binding chemotaxis protein CheW|uniref:chemotaxis protein CheW n=1 Tax=Desulfobotulus sp. TaxID=1940337 RepID=UPI002A35B93E|nr:chemotaxis protein CheW [Desulfobotulus sp.]MDY0161665.1 chemotaxis protein CheW [Desulfobotulus sp.]